MRDLIVIQVLLNISIFAAGYGARGLFVDNNWAALGLLALVVVNSTVQQLLAFRQLKNKLLANNVPREERQRWPYP